MACVFCLLIVVGSGLVGSVRYSLIGLSLMNGKCRERAVLGADTLGSGVRVVYAFEINFNSAAAVKAPPAMERRRHAQQLKIPTMDVFCVCLDACMSNGFVV